MTQIEIGQFVRAYRKQSSVTMEGLEKKAFVTRNTIRDFERSAHAIRIDSLLLILDALGLELEVKEKADVSN